MKNLILSAEAKSPSPKRKMQNFALFCSLLVMLFVMSTERGGAITCDTGYSTATIEITVFGCTYFVDVCYKCTPYGLSDNWISIKEYHLKNPCTEIKTSEEINEAIHADLPNHIYDLCGLPPCNDNNLTYKKWNIVKYVCWEKKKVGGVIYRQPNTNCSSARCIFRFFVCYNGTISVFSDNNEGQETNYGGDGTAGCTESNTEATDAATPNDNTWRGCYYKMQPCFP